jgi:hypothetical protein
VVLICIWCELVPAHQHLQHVWWLQAPAGVVKRGRHHRTIADRCTNLLSSLTPFTAIRVLCLVCRVCR